MELDTTKIRKYNHILKKSIDTKDYNRSYMYIDLEEDRLKFLGEGYTGHIEIGLSYKNSIAEKHKGFMVYAPIFLTLCNEYENLTIEEIDDGSETEKMKFSYDDGETFLSCDFSGTISGPVKELDDIEDTYDEIQITTDIWELLRQAHKYVGRNEGGKRYDGVIFLEKSIASVFNGFAVFEGYVANDNYLPKEQTIPKYLVSLLIDYGKMEDVSLYTSDGPNAMFMRVGDDEVWIEAAYITGIEVPPLRDNKFRKKFEHESSIVVDKHELYDLLNFFAPYLDEDENQILWVNIEDKDSIRIEATKNNRGSKILSTDHCSDSIIGEKFAISRDFLMKALQDISDDLVRIRVDFDPSSSAIDIVGKEEESVHLIMTRMV